jgi:DNA-binding FrmR family transcriptional regulator
MGEITPVEVAQDVARQLPAWEKEVERLTSAVPRSRAEAGRLVVQIDALQEAVDKARQRLSEAGATQC